MDTFFDHNPTDAEVKDVIGYAISRDEYLALPFDQDGEYATIYRLYIFRGDDKTAARYLSQISDPDFRFATQLSDIEA